MVRRQYIKAVMEKHEFEYRKNVRTKSKFLEVSRYQDSKKNKIDNFFKKNSRTRWTLVDKDIDEKNLACIYREKRVWKLMETNLAISDFKDSNSRNKVKKFSLKHSFTRG